MPRSRDVTVVVCDRRPLAREGLRRVLEAGDQTEVVATCDVSTAVAAVSTHRPTVLVVGEPESDVDLWQAVADARTAHPDLRTLVVADDVSVVDVQAGVLAGVDSFVLNTVEPDEFTGAVLTTARGDRAVSPAIAMHLAATWQEPPRAGDESHHLTARELDVMAKLAEGLTNKEVGETLGMSTRSVKTHVQSLLTKLDVPDRTAAVARAFRLGIVR